MRAEIGVEVYLDLPVDHFRSDDERSSAVEHGAQDHEEDVHGCTESGAADICVLF